jgi:hypothetical protein
VEIEQGLAQVNSLFLRLGEQRVLVPRGEAVQRVSGVGAVPVQLILRARYEIKPYQLGTYDRKQKVMTEGAEKYTKPERQVQLFAISIGIYSKYSGCGDTTR